MTKNNLTPTAAAPKITRYHPGELDLVTVSRPDFDKIYMTAHPGQNDMPHSMFSGLAETLHQRNAQVITQYVFGGRKLHEAGLESLEEVFGKVTWPVTWIEADGQSGSDLTGTQIYAIRGTDLRPVTLDGHPVGGVFEDRYATYCLLGDLRPDDTSEPREMQTRKTFEKMETALEHADMDFSNVLRTWIYLDDLLNWYGPFNAVRTEFFEERGVFDGLIPASTGIGVSNPAGAALVTDVFAVKPKTDETSIKPLLSPLQCPATSYRSSFSRAVEMQTPESRRIFISGTASIDPEGTTVHVGDVEKQIELTMEVVKAILDSREANWDDTVRAIAYFKDIKDVAAFRRYCRDKNVTDFPVALAHADICRDDLLFEIELDTVCPIRP